MCVSLLQRALERLESLAFVGITDRWAESACLFHAQFGGRLHPAEVRAFRQKDHSVAQEAREVSDAELRDLDAWDTQVFERAKALFEGRLALYGVPAEDGLDGHTQYVAACNAALDDLDRRRAAGGRACPRRAGSTWGCSTLSSFRRYSRPRRGI